MAKQVSNVFIRLGIENFEGIEKLKSAFRELDRSIGPTSRSIDAAVAAVRNYADASTRSEQLIRGQIEAFKGLRSQVDVSGRQYSELTTEINQLQAELRGSTDAVDRQRQALLSSFNQNERNVRTIREHVNALTQLQTQTRANSSAFIALGADVDLAAERLANAERVLSTLRSVLTRGLPATGAGAQRRITELDEGIRAQQAIIDEIDLRVPAERNLASVIRERAEAEERLNRSLVDRRQLAFQERVRAGRQDVRIAAEAFSNPPVGGTGFLSIENIGRRIGSVPNTIAGINQELGEMRERLSNVALEGRDFIEVLDYIDTLNRRLRSVTTEFQTPRQQALADVQARLDAQRQTLAQSGFGAFSASISGRSFRAEARSKTDAAISTASTAMEEAYTARIEAARAGIRRNTELEVQQLRLLDEEDEKNHQATMQRMADEAAAGTRWFNEQMALSDRLTRRSSVLINTLGFGGRDLSSFYQGVIDIGTARQRSTQQLMGRTPEQAIGDIYRMSTISQTRTGEGSLDAEQALRQRAIAYSGNSRAVQQAFATYAAGQTPGALYPKTGESSTAYIRRVETSMEQGLTTTLTRFRNFVDVFGEKLRGAGDGYLQSERDLRRAAIRFSGNAPAVIEAFRRAPLGTTSTALLPKGNESREDYVARLGVGATAENFRLPAIPHFSKNTVRELQDIRQRLQDVRLDLDPLAANFEATERRITKSVQRIDRELSKRETGGRRGLGGRQLTQIAGAALSGGIFGGPEGFLGGVIGGAVGGVGGAFAGAAFGAQAGMFRQQLGLMADYAAQLEKLRTSLKGITASNKEYQQALNVTILAGTRFNLLPVEATQSFTRLLASVKGAGGGVKDAEVAFNSVTAAIKATGGGAEQVDGALLALSQVFSKGKVSAEELNQIAERLPGTFTLFAKSAGMTGPELQKALQDGTVSLNDFMKFVVTVGDKYTPIMDKLANSTQNAGERMKVSFANLRVAIGDALTPIGAGIQNTIASLSDMALAALRAMRLVREASGIEITVQREKDIKNAVGAAYRAVQSQGAQGVIPGFADPRKEAFTRINEALKSITPQLGLEGTRQNIAALKDLVEVQRRLTVGNEVTPEVRDRRMRLLESQARTLSGRLADEEARLKRLQEADRRGLTKFSKPGGKDETAGQKIRDKSAADAQRTAETLAQQQIRLDDTVFAHRQDLARQEYELRKELIDLETKNRLDQMGSVEREAAQALEQRNQRETQYREKLMQAEADVAKAQQDLLSARRMAAATGGGTTGRTGLPAGMSGYISGDPRSPYYQADHGGANYHEHLSFISRKAAEAAYALLVKAGLKVTEFKGYSPVGRHTPGSAHYSGLAMDVPASQVPVGAERTLTARVLAALGIGATAASAQQRRNIVDTGDAGVAFANLEQAKARLSQVRGYGSSITAAAEVEYTNALTKAFRDQNEELQRTIANETLRANLQSKGYTETYIDLQLKLSDALDRRNKQISTLSFVEAETPNRIDAINSSYKQLTESLQQLYLVQESLANAPGFREGAKRYVESLGTMREATANLTQQGFKGLEDTLVSLSTTGTANFQAFAASILEQTARMIIQQLVLKSIMQALGGFGGGPDRSFGTLMAGVNKYSANANGNVFAANGIVPYAMGGIVTRPTLFPFANGGAIGTGLMGEAGPEAIIPLSRGANGKLGIAGGGGTTNVVVNVDASGNAQVQGREDTANQLGRVISQAVQAELIKQKRPGGLLA